MSLLISVDRRGRWENITELYLQGKQDGGTKEPAWLGREPPSTPTPSGLCAHTLTSQKSLSPPSLSQPLIPLLRHMNIFMYIAFLLLNRSVNLITQLISGTPYLTF